LLKDTPEIIIIAIIGFFTMMVVFYHSSTAYEQDTIVVVANETIRASALANRDDSARVEQGQFKLQKESFELDFIKLFESNLNLDLSGFKFDFDYLEDSLGGVKGVKIKIVTPDEVFETTTILSNPV